MQVCKFLIKNPIRDHFLETFWKFQNTFKKFVQEFAFSCVANCILSLREKCPNTEFFPVRIFLYSFLIQENTDQKKLRIWTLFTLCVTLQLLLKGDFSKFLEKLLLGACHAHVRFFDRVAKCRNFDYFTKKSSVMAFSRVLGCRLWSCFILKSDSNRGNSLKILRVLLFPQKSMGWILIVVATRNICENRLVHRHCQVIVINTIFKARSYGLQF